MKILPGKSARPETASAGFPTGALVMYEHDGAPLLASILGFKKDKYTLLNERGREVEMAAIRLYALPGQLPSTLTKLEERVRFLSDLRQRAQAQASSIKLEELWQVLCEQARDYNNKELTELYFSDNTLSNHLALRLALLSDPTFFKRSKDSFTPRPATVVEELKKAEAARQEKLRVQHLTLAAFKARLTDQSYPLPADIKAAVRLLEDYAARAELDHVKQKEAKELLELAAKELSLVFTGTKEQQAFTLLERIGHFRPDTNLSIIRQRPPLQFSREALDEARLIQVPQNLEGYEASERAPRFDLTGLASLTIDDFSTKDMDDALSLERTESGYRLGIHVSDVASIVPPSSTLDWEARQRATSMYLPDQTVNMLPEVLSQDKLSLVQGTVRPCLSCLFEVDQSLQVHGGKIVPSLIRVQKRYAYDEVDQLLESENGDLSILYNISVNRELQRMQQGALKVFKHDLQITIGPDGQVNIMEFDEHGPARSLVGEMMILANTLLANYAAQNKIPVVFRLQESPDEPAADVPSGPAKDYALRASLKKSTIAFTPGWHAGLALKAYLQATSPIRRYIDLCNQRQILHHLRTGSPFYTLEEFERIVQETEEPLMKAGIIAKETKRYWLLKYLDQRRKRKSPANPQADLIKGTVLRSDLKNPLVELDEVFLPALVKLDMPVKPGDVLTLKIAAVDPRYDYLKLEKT